jgi:hypothetical protein
MARAAGYPKFRPDPPSQRESPIRREPRRAWQPTPMRAKWPPLPPGFGILVRSDPKLSDSQRGRTAATGAACGGGRPASAKPAGRCSSSEAARIIDFSRDVVVARLPAILGPIWEYPKRTCTVLQESRGSPRRSPKILRQGLPQ